MRMKKLGIPLFTLAILIPASGWTDTTMAGTISTDTTWTAAGSPYIVTSSITVKGTDGADGITTLSIEPGVQVRFNGNYTITIGATSDDPGNKATPAAGDWGYIQFNATAAAASVMDHCVVEYGGGASNGSVYLSSASPTIQNSVIRHGKNAGVYASGCGCSTTAITGSAGPVIIYWHPTIGDDCSHRSSVF